MSRLTILKIATRAISRVRHDRPKPAADDTLRLVDHRCQRTSVVCRRFARADSGAEAVTVTQYMIRWGDGTPETNITAADLAAGGGQFVHTYADGPLAPTIILELFDEDGTHPNAGLLDITVKNVAPTLIEGDAGDDQLTGGDGDDMLVTVKKTRWLLSSWWIIKERALSRGR